jgi:hypothetical protein
MFGQIIQAYPLTLAFEFPLMQQAAPFRKTQQFFPRLLVSIELAYVLT